MKVKIAILLALAASVMMGCAKKSVVGTWTTSYDNYPVTTEFKPDGSLEIRAAMGEFKATVTGTYVLENEKLTIIGNEVKTENVPDPIATSIKESVKQSWNRTGTIEWVSNDEFKYSEQGETITFERQKPNEQPAK